MFFKFNVKLIGAKRFTGFHKVTDNSSCPSEHELQWLCGGGASIALSYE